MNSRKKEKALCVLFRDADNRIRTYDLIITNAIHLKLIEYNRRQQKRKKHYFIDVFRYCLIQ